MGIFKNLKEIFNKNIECDEEIDNHIILPIKKKYLYLNKNIYVRDNTACVIVYNDKVTDVVYAGKYRLNGDTIPETYSRAKIEKQINSGVKVKKIRVKIYYVNLTEFKNFDYISDTPFKTKANSLGKVKGCISGTCVLKILDPGAIISKLININSKIKIKDINNNVGTIIGNKINCLIQKEKIHLDMLFNNREYVERILNTDMEDALDKEGLFVKNIKLKAINFNKKHQKKINTYISTQNTKLQPINTGNVLESVGVNKVKISVTSGRGGVVEQQAMQSVQKTSNNNSFIRCNKCNKLNQNNARICINCGAKLY